MCKDLTNDCIPIVSDAIRSWMKESADKEQFRIIPGEFDQVSMIN